MTLLLFPPALSSGSQLLNVCAAPTSSVLSAMADESKYVTLISCEGFEYVVLRDAALISPVVKGMIDPKSEDRPPRAALSDHPC